MVKQSVSGDNITYDWDKGVITMASDERTDCFCPFYQPFQPHSDRGLQLFPGWQKTHLGNAAAKEGQSGTEESVLRGGKTLRIRDPHFGANRLNSNVNPGQPPSASQSTAFSTPGADQRSVNARMVRVGDLPVLLRFHATQRHALVSLSLDRLPLRGAARAAAFTGRRDWLARREGLRGRVRIVPAAIVLTWWRLAMYRLGFL